jgi:GTPase SAR1 family protein/uncharacterized protein (DUF697 family)
VSGRRSNLNLFFLLTAAFVGLMVVVLPPLLADNYVKVTAIHPYLGYAYLAALAVLALGVVAIVVQLAANTRRRRQALRSGAALDAQGKTRVVERNLAEAAAIAGEAEEAERQAIHLAARELEAKRDTQVLEIVAFGTISSGKSSLLNALAGEELLSTDVRGGTTIARREVPWPGGDRIVLVDTPGLAEIAGEQHRRLAEEAARHADLVLFVVDGTLKGYEFAALREVAQLNKRVVVCLNKADWFSERDRPVLLGQLREQTRGLVRDEDIVAVRSRRTSRVRVLVLPNGSEREELVEVEPDIGPLAERMLAIVERDGPDLLLANLLLRSSALLGEARALVRETLDRRAAALIDRAMWQAGAVAAVMPLPVLDLAAGSAVTLKLVVDLARVYRQSITLETAAKMAEQLGKNLLASSAASLAVPSLAALAGSSLKTVPGVGTIAGGFLQGLTQALVTAWIGRVFARYFRDGLVEDDAALAELARSEWRDVTKPHSLVRLVQEGYARLGPAAREQPGRATE